MDSFREAYEEVTRQTANHNERFVSLYATDCVYGGPEEGGWWRTIVTLVQTQRYPSPSAAHAALCQINNRRAEIHAALADASGRRPYRRPDETEYFVAIEKKPGEQEFADAATYE